MLSFSNNGSSLTSSLDIAFTSATLSSFSFLLFLVFAFLVNIYTAAPTINSTIANPAPIPPINDGLDNIDDDDGFAS